MDSDALQQDYARAEAKYLSAKALVFETWNDIEASMERGEPLSTRQQTMMRLALYNMTWSVHEVCMFVYTRGGTTALRAGRSSATSETCTRAPSTSPRRHRSSRPRGASWRASRPTTSGSSWSWWTPA